MPCCIFPKCKHNNNKNKCRYFTFPEQDDKKFFRWKHLLGLSTKFIKSFKDPRVCSCHFEDEEKSNDPVILNKMANILYFKSPENKHKKNRKKTRTVSSITSSSEFTTNFSTFGAIDFNEFVINMIDQGIDKEQSNSMQQDENNLNHLEYVEDNSDDVILEPPLTEIKALHDHIYSKRPYRLNTNRNDTLLTTQENELNHVKETNIMLNAVKLINDAPAAEIIESLNVDEMISNVDYDLSCDELHNAVNETENDITLSQNRVAVVEADKMINDVPPAEMNESLNVDEMIANVDYDMSCDELHNAVNETENDITLSQNRVAVVEADKMINDVPPAEMNESLNVDEMIANVDYDMSSDELHNAKETANATHTLNLDHTDEPSYLRSIPKISFRKPNYVPGIPNINGVTPLFRMDMVLEAENSLLKAKIEMLQKQLNNNNTFHFKFIENNDQKVLDHTGLPNKKMFYCVLKLMESAGVVYQAGWKVTQISKSDQLLITLMKMRMNLKHYDLAQRFNCSTATISNIVRSWVLALHHVLFIKLMSKIPSKSKTETCLPNSFSTFTNCRIILDCTELYCDSPKNLKKQRMTYSSYKHHNTCKALITVAPNGVIVHMSDLYPGCYSDKKIVNHCGILNQLDIGDLILADKGFLLRDILPYGVNLNVPPFLLAPQFTKQEVEQGEKIAKARIHVERAINRLKNFDIIKYIPAELSSISTEIFQLCGALSNFQNPLINEVADKY